MSAAAANEGEPLRATVANEGKPLRATVANEGKPLRATVANEGKPVSLPAPVETMASPLRMDYTFVAGAGRSVFLRGLARRRLLASRCPGCSRVYAPAPEFCSRCLRPVGPPFELPGFGEVVTFCVVSFPFPGQVYEPPYVVAHIRLDGADTHLMHLVREVEPERVRIGLRVEPVWVGDDELDTSTTSIRYFRPLEPAHA